MASAQKKIHFTCNDISTNASLNIFDTLKKKLSFKTKFLFPSEDPRKVIIRPKLTSFVKVYLVMVQLSLVKVT